MIELAEYYKEMELKDLIQEGSPIYFFRSTPFTDHGEFNYNGMLTPDFFFKNLFSPIGKCLAYIDEIKNSLINRQHKSILLIGNQGCGKKGDKRQSEYGNTRSQRVDFKETYRNICLNSTEEQQ